MVGQQSWRYVRRSVALMTGVCSASPQDSKAFASLLYSSLYKQAPRDPGERAIYTYNLPISFSMGEWR